jgi:hypothetical protein
MNVFAVTPTPSQRDCARGTDEPISHARRRPSDHPRHVSQQRRDSAEQVGPAPAHPPRRPADRHYQAVVAAELRRLGRQLRPSTPTQGSSNPSSSE